MMYLSVSSVASELHCMLWENPKVDDSALGLSGLASIAIAECNPSGTINHRSAILMLILGEVQYSGSKSGRGQEVLE